MPKYVGEGHAGIQRCAVLSKKIPGSPVRKNEIVVEVEQDQAFICRVYRVQETLFRLFRFDQRSGVCDGAAIALEHAVVVVKCDPAYAAVQTLPFSVLPFVSKIANAIVAVHCVGKRFPVGVRLKV